MSNKPWGTDVDKFVVKKWEDTWEVCEPGTWIMSEYSSFEDAIGYVRSKINQAVADSRLRRQVVVY